MSSLAGTRAWIVNRPVDLLLAGSGLAFALYLPLALFVHGAVAPALLAFAGLLSVLGNGPHFMASYVRLYGERDTRRAHPLVAYVAPLLLAAGVVGTLVSPRGFGAWFIKAHVIWSGYHYSGQTYGIALLYCRKRDLALHAWEKWLLLGPIAFSYLLPTISFEAGQTGGAFYNLPYPTIATALHDAFGLAPPAWLNQATAWGYGAAIAAFVGWLAVRRFRGASVPLPAVLAVAAQMLWFTVVGANPTFSLFVPLFHSLQYLVVIYAFHRGAWLQEGQPLNRLARRHYAFLVLLGIFLFGAVPGVLAQYGCDRQVAYAAVIVFINLHHYMIDGVIWKLRRPELRRALVTPLEQAA